MRHIVGTCDTLILCRKCSICYSSTWTAATPLTDHTDVMPAAPLPPDELDRLSMLDALHLLDTPPEPVFDRVTRLASRMLDVPMALFSLVDADRQWFKSRVGLDSAETPREH